MRKTIAGRRGHRAAIVLTALVVVVGVATSLSAAAALTAGQERTAAGQMDRRVTLVAEAVEAETGRYTDTLQTVAAATGAFATLTRDKFVAATEPLKRMRLAGASSIVFLVPATDAQTGPAQAAWRSRGADGLVFKPRSGAREHLYTVFSLPLDDAPPSAAGTDISQVAAPAAALAEARRSGRVAVSDTYELLRDKDLPAAERQLSFVLTAPVFDTAGPDGKRNLRGWVLMGLRGQDFIGATLQRTAQDVLDVTLRAQNAQRAPVNVARMRAPVAGDRNLNRTVDIPVADRRWSLELAANGSALPGGRSGLPTVTAATGIILSFLLAGLVWVLATGRARARAQVRTATADLGIAEAAARHQAGLLQAVLDNVSDGIGVVDANGEFLLHNPAAKAMLGIEEDRGGSENWQDHYGLFRMDGTTPFPVEEMPLVRAMTGEAAEQVDMLIRNGSNPDGITISVSARPLDLGEGLDGAVAVFHDITARKHTEAELKAYAGVVAHDLKSPLTAIRGYAEIADEALLDQPGAVDAGNARRAMSKILAAVERMQRLISDLLDFTAARDAALNMVPVNLRALVDEVITTRLDGENDGEGPRPDIYVGPLPAVNADPVLLRQVIDNLIGNALKYTPPGQLARIDITARAATQSGRVRVQVADRGIGIPEGQHTAVFASFHRAHTGTGYAGTGLGLAICKRIIERHGGVITASDNPGGGAVFHFTLPVATSNPPAAAGRSAAHRDVAAA